MEAASSEGAISLSGILASELYLFFREERGGSCSGEVGEREKLGVAGCGTGDGLVTFGARVRLEGVIHLLLTC